MRDFALCFLPTNDNASRQNDVASLARTCLLIVARGRDTPIKRKNRGNCQKTTEGAGGGGDEREILDAHVSERPYQGDPERSLRGGKRVAYPRRSPRDAD